MTRPTITSYDWSPDGPRGLVRDVRVRWALEEVGQAYDVRYLSWGEQKEAAHRTRSPFGQVPTFEKGDLVLFESGAIILYIARQHSGLFPGGADAKARAEAWLLAALNSVEPPVWDYVVAKIIEAREPWAETRLPVVEARLRTRLGELSNRLGDADWLDGDFSAGDLMMVSVLRPLGTNPILQEFPNLAAYVARGEARPAFRRSLDARLAGLTGAAPAGWPH
ncbi:putative glutathione S-transferase [Sphingomonas sp. EC-HK361]|uniref:glutathione S-transferase family protein n=1 Tax=Sphingomonas sp. EC-HK361 TaxID=2038397 RepID=UPI0012553074|nr:glutathione S-transferase family protein [Sphingomonas sp. EC-HK361]VVT13237.1 putative glutathione S-transferase [Sphingomonas sp. EC-HK361]